MPDGGTRRLDHNGCMINHPSANLRVGDAERARVAVAHTLRYAIERLAEQSPALATHLTGSIHTGTYCCYRPDPLSNVGWTT